MGILLQLLFTSESSKIAIPSLIMFLKGIELVLARLIWCLDCTSHILKHDPNPSFPLPPS